MSETLSLSLRKILDGGLGLMKHLGLEYRHNQPIPTPDQMKTEEEAKIAGISAAVQALVTIVGPLVGPRRSTTPEQGEQALENLRQRRTIADAYHTAWSQTLTQFCLGLEAALDEEDLREGQHHPE